MVGSISSNFYRNHRLNFLNINFNTFFSTTGEKIVKGTLYVTILQHADRIVRIKSC